MHTEIEYFVVVAFWGFIFYYWAAWANWYQARPKINWDTCISIFQAASTIKHKASESYYNIIFLSIYTLKF
jgi:hypothetical protein